MDAYRWYHKIQMHKVDEEKTSVYTDMGKNYTKMPFRLKNAGATYKRLARKVFEPQVGKNI